MTKQLTEVLDAKRFRVPHGYIIISYDGGNPVEVFASWSGEADPTQMARRSNQEFICRLVSLALRNGVSVDEIKTQAERSSLQVGDFPDCIRKCL